MKKLIIRNLKDFFEMNFDNQFQVLADLEKQIQNSNETLHTVLSDKAVFDLVKIDFIKKNTVYTYQYTITAS